MKIKGNYVKVKVETKKWKWFGGLFWFKANLAISFLKHPAWDGDIKIWKSENENKLSESKRKYVKSESEI